MNSTIITLSLIQSLSCTHMTCQKARFELYTSLAPTLATLAQMTFTSP